MKKRIGLCLLCLMVFSSGMAWADILIIAHQKVPETTITAKDLQEIFLGNRVQWKDNSAIKPVTVKDAKLHEAFLKQYIKKRWPNGLPIGSGRCLPAMAHRRSSLPRSRNF